VKERLFYDSATVAVEEGSVQLTVAVFDITPYNKADYKK